MNYKYLVKTTTGLRLDSVFKHQTTYYSPPPRYLAVISRHVAGESRMLHTSGAPASASPLTSRPRFCIVPAPPLAPFAPCVADAPCTRNASVDANNHRVTSVVTRIPMAATYCCNSSPWQKLCAMLTGWLKNETGEIRVRCVIKGSRQCKNASRFYTNSSGHRAGSAPQFPVFSCLFCPSLVCPF